MKQTPTSHILLVLLLILATACKKLENKETKKRYIWNLNALKKRAKENLNNNQWNHTLLEQDIETYNKYAEIFKKYPLNNYPFPVADYDYAVYSNPFTFKVDSLIFKGIEIGEYKDTSSEKVTIKLTLIVVTNNDTIEPECFVDSRNFPYLTAEGNFNTPKNEFKWVFSSSPDGYSTLFFSMKLFDLRFGETIIIYPQKDNSFLYEQIDESPNRYSKFTDYIQKIKNNKHNLNRLRTTVSYF